MLSRMFRATAVALAVTAATTTTAFAVVVDPGEVGMLPGATEVSAPWLAGTVLVDELFNFSLPALPGSSDLITGTVQQHVVRETTSGTLDFYWRVVSLSGGGLGHLRVGSFTTSTFDADWRIDSLGDVGPRTLQHFAPGEGGATDAFSANFSFVTEGGTPGLSAGQSSKFMFLHTDATHYARTAIFDLANVGTTTASAAFGAYAPAAVPEPGTWALMLGGLAAVGAARRRRAAR